MRNPNQNWWIVIVAVVVVVAILLWWIWGRTIPGFYKPGQLADRPVFVPEQEGDPSFWNVENDVKLYHFTDGAGEPVLVLHGGAGMPFAEPVPAFAELTGFRMEYYDQRGCGRSTHPFDRFNPDRYFNNVVRLEEKLGIAAQLKDIERIRKILGVEQVTLMGHSYGGFLAALYAAEFPGHVRALILISPADLLKFPGEDEGLFVRVGNMMPDSLREAYSAWMRSYFDYRNIFDRSEAELRDINNAFLRFYQIALQQKGYSMPNLSGSLDYTGGWMVHAMNISMGQEHDYREALRNVQAPVLVLHGADDLQPASASQAYAELFANGQFRLIPGSSHFPFVEQPDAFIRDVREFLANRLAVSE